MNLRKLIAGLMLALGILAGFTGVASAGELVPFNGTLEGTYTATPIDPQEPLIVDIQLDAAGQATHLGKYTLDFPHVVNRKNRPATGAGFCTFTAANGDQVFAYIEGEARLIVPGLLNGVEYGTILGGTGRFVDATGEFTITRLINQQAGTTVGSFEGFISSPGASGK